MLFSYKSALVGVAAFALVPVAACAEPGDTFTITGDSQAVVVDPATLVKLEDLRFGTFHQPSAAAQMTITPGGTATATGEIATTMNVAQGPAGRGPASFLVIGEANRLFIGTTPSAVDITNGSSTMQVRNMNNNLLLSFLGRLNFDGEFTLNIGGTLNVSANQEPGQYSGDFEVTVLYL